MIATPTDYLALIEAMPEDTVTILNHVDWDDFDSLVYELEGRRDVRLSYYRGKMMLMTSSAEHEQPAHALPYLIFVLAQECGMNYLSCGSSTLRKSTVASGTEPDDCYYFHNFQAIAGKKWLDLDVDPPPDLVVEVDITSPSLNKFPIYAAFGVPELWRHDGERMFFYRLIDGDYEEIAQSDLFPFLTPEAVTIHLQLGITEGIIVMANSFKDWVKAQRQA
jgi:Uma2 family endonuclease